MRDDITSSARQPSFPDRSVTLMHVRRSMCATILIVSMLALIMPAQISDLTRRIAGGTSHTLVVLPNGTVMTCGNNANGALGLGNNTSYPSLESIPLSSLSNVVAVAAGHQHSLALLRDGTVKAWGWGAHGQLGLGTTTSELTPQPIPAATLSSVVAIAAGYGHSLALLEDGSVMAWGLNSDGQLGLGHTINESTPQLITAVLYDVVAIAAGAYHSLVLLGNGTVMSWGDNAYGQLGLGHYTQENYPQSIPMGPLNNVLSIRAGESHSLALLGNGTVRSWGNGSWGMLGLGGYAHWATPQAIPETALDDVIEITAGATHSLAILADGAVKAWGSNLYGQLGLGTTGGSVATPEFVASLGTTSATAVYSAGGYGSRSYAVVLDGTVRAWGENSAGELGIGAYSNQNLPQCILGLNTTGIRATAPTTSPIGSTIAWDIGCFLGTTPGALYFFDVSITGTSPGTFFPGLGTIPLNYPMLNIHYGHVFGPALTNFVGLLDASGHAMPTLATPHHPALIGTTFSGAAIRLNPASTSLLEALTPVAADTELVVSVAEVTSVFPTTSTTGGGASLTILGSGFVLGATVTLGGTPCPNVVVLDQWTLTCSAPAHAAGTGSVVVTNFGAAAGLWTGQFTWLAPVITSVLPNSGPAAGGTNVSINGANFHPGAAVMFGLTAATTVTFFDSGLVTAIAPPHTPGTLATVWVSITNPGGVSAFLPAAFTYN